MALDTSKIKLPREVVTEFINKAKDTSTIAQLSPSTPKSFVDFEHMVFSPSAEAEVVAEGAAKGSYEQEIDPVSAKRIKVVTTTRVSDELQWADEDDRLEIVSGIVEDQSAAIGRALDYVVYHAVNPKTGTALDGYTALSTSAVQVTSVDDEVTNLDALADALLDYNITGIALSRSFAASLRKVRASGTGLRLFPEIPLSLGAGSVDGVPASVSGTVNGRKAATATGVRSIMGDFSLIKWGYVRDAWTEVIPYGDPDGAGTDLKSVNQVALRTEAVLGFAVLDPSGFAVLKSAAA